MDMNTRSTNGRTNHTAAFITTTDRRRRTLWLRLFGTAVLPVLHPRPRWQWLPGRQYEALAYDLNVQALPSGALDRLAAYVSRRADWPYDYARAAVQGGWAITAVNCRLATESEKPVSDAASAESEPASFLPVWGWGVFAREHVVYA